MEGVSKYRQYSQMETVGNAYVIIPTKVDRDDYVITCFRKERVSLLTENGSVIKNAYISREALKNIEFPKNSDELGSFVSFVVNSFNNHPIVIGIVSKEAESQLLEEGEFRLRKDFNNSSVSITGKAKTGDLLINVNNEDGNGTLIINVKGKDSSKLKIFVGGEATIFSDDIINLETAGEVNIKSIEKDDEENYSIINVKNNEVNIIPSENGVFKVKSGSEPVLLGNKTQEELNKEKSILEAITEVINGQPIPETGNGVASSFQLALKVALTGKNHGDFSDIKSEISFTD